MDTGAFLALVLSCAPHVAPDTLTAIARQESGLQPWLIHDNKTGRTIAPLDQREAVKTARELIDAGHNVDMGLMQVNSVNLGALGLDVVGVFEPCANVRAAADILAMAFRNAQTDGKSPDEALLIALSLYNTGHRSAGFGNGYVRQVESNATAYIVPPLTRAGVTIAAPLEQAPAVAAAQKASASQSSDPFKAAVTGDPFVDHRAGDPFANRGGAVASSGALSLSSGAK